MSNARPFVPLSIVGAPVRPDLDDDARLAIAAAEGRPDAHRALWTRFQPLVRRLAQRQLGPDADLEDLVQEIFALVFRDLKTLREPRAIGSFVGTIAVHLLRRELRRRRLRRLVSLTSSGDAPEPEPNEPDPVARLALRRVYALLDRFRATHRMVFVLRHIEGQSVDDVAAALDLSPATVKRHSASVLAKLTKLVRTDAFLADYLRQGEGHG